MPKKYEPTPEMLQTILTRYNETKNFSLVSRETGLSYNILKRIITEHEASGAKNEYIYTGPMPLETELPTKAMYYHQIICLMKEHLHV